MYVQCNEEIYIPTLVTLYTLIHYTQFFTAVSYVNLPVYFSTRMANTAFKHVKIIYFRYFSYYLKI